MSAIKMQMVAGLDIGNGYVKGWISTDKKAPSGVDFLSGVAIQTNSSDIKTPHDDIGPVVADIFNNMEASFDSPAIESKTLRLFGKRGVASGKSMEEFDVSSTLSKAKQDLSGYLILGSLAGKAVQEYWADHQALPTETIQVDARIAIALPITEYKNYRKYYAERYRTGTHMVSISNFELPVRVEIAIVDVQVLAEGASAQFAIVEKGEPLMEAMLADVRKHGEKLEGITAADILAAGNTVGIDIGEGTVNFPVFQGGRFNADVSMSFMKGYGTVLENANERLREMGLPFQSRKSLADFLLQKETALNKARFSAVRRIVDEEIEGFAMEVTQEFRKILSRTGSYVEVVYVYGGGATPVKESLYPKLIQAAKSFGGEESAYPILYLDSRYSRYLNREGLYSIAKRVADGAEAKAKKPEK